MIIVLRIIKKLINDEGGQSLVIIAAGMIALLGFAALTTDVGYYYFQKRHLQNTADSAALAAAWILPNGDVQDEAEEYAAKHNVENENVAAEIIGDEVEVIITKDYPRFFGKIWGSDEVTISALARAKQTIEGLRIAPIAPRPENYDVEWDGWVDTDDYGDNRVFVEPLIDNDWTPDGPLDLREFKEYLEKYRLPHQNIGLFDRDGNAVRGFINIKGTENISGTNEIAEWLESETLPKFDLDEDEGYEVITGQRQTIFGQPHSAMEKFLINHSDYGEGETSDSYTSEFYVLLPHPDADMSQPTDILEEYLVAKIHLEIKVDNGRIYIEIPDGDRTTVEDWPGFVHLDKRFESQGDKPSGADQKFMMGGTIKQVWLPGDEDLQESGVTRKSAILTK